MGLGGGTGNVPFASPASREAYQAARQAHAANDRLSQNVSSPSRRSARSPSDDSDSDNQPLSQRRRRRNPRPVFNSGPSSIPSPPPTVAASPPSPHVTPPPIPGPVTDPPNSSNTQAEPPLAHPSTSQHAHDNEAGPSERPSTIPPAASHALRAEIKDLTSRKNNLEVSLALTNHELEELQEKQSQADNVHQQSMNQQALEHQRAMDQLVQKLRAAETLVQDQDQKLKSQEALLKSQETQLTSQATELATARSELAQARATTEGVSTALAIYREGENDRFSRILCTGSFQNSRERSTNSSS
ncbi:probable serine/threonine-protein kinase samkC [Zingiber officinale]|uniref:probable serine/threonine-protein kinase samkC n=1 Tax=Zingiber officinale TaxID=94328 RepID=UPI001C4B00AD|nr:probable serine/threonine-protein kinase samkC [Zingiber officinale]